MRRAGHIAAVVGSIFAMLVIATSFTVTSHDKAMTASTATYCQNEFTGQICNCESVECLQYNPDEGTSNPPLECENPYTNEPCECNTAACYERPETTTEPPPETCENLYTSDPCDCANEDCINHNPNEETYIEPPAPVDVHCPIPERSGRTILDFTKNGSLTESDLEIRADNDADSATKVYLASSIEPGVYKVHLASYHPLDSTVSTDSYGERWYLELYDTNNNKVLKTEATRYTDYKEIHIEETVEDNATISSRTNKAIARHTSYPNSKAFKFAPLCAAFDYIGEIEETTVTDPSEETTTDESTTDEETTVTTTDETEELDVHTDQNMVTIMGCPINRDEGRIIVDFTKNKQIPINNLILRSNRDAVDSRTNMYSTNIPRGIYTVRLSSFGFGFDSEIQDEQSWYVKLLNSENRIVAETPKIEDIPSWAENSFTKIISSEFTIGEPVSKLVGIHGAYPDSDPNSLAPLCVSFDMVGKIEETPVEDDSPEKLPEDSIETETVTRNIFAPPEEQYDSSVETRTKIIIPDDSERVETSPKEIGIEETGENVTVHKDVIEARKRIIEEDDEIPFNRLLSARQNEREEITNRIIKEEATRSGIDEEEVRTKLARRSEEEETQEMKEERENDAKIAYEEFRYKQRRELAENKDTDGDGVTDYDEEYIYKTDPKNPFTGGSVLTDGERILLGLNPTDDSRESVVLESPKVVGEEVKEIFTVEEIVLYEDEDSAKRVRISGIAQPLSFLTLYMYSTPIIVTVRSDGEGRFEYIFDETLEDGSHEVYVTSVNNSGKILAKSEPNPFIKTAEAIQFTPAQVSNETNPVNDAMQTIITLSLILVLLITIGMIVWLGFSRAHQHEQKVITENEEE